MSEFKVGDRVHVSDGDNTYSIYKDFFKENGLEYFKGDWARGVTTPEGDYTIAATGKHLDIREDTLYLLRGDDRKIYISGNRYGYLTLIEEGRKANMFKVGDKVIPVDGSWSITTKDGDLKPTCGVAINKRKWEVMATDVSIPPIDYACKFETDIDWQGEYVRNDLVLKCVEDGEIIFIRSDNCRLIPQPIPFSEAVKAAIAGKKPVIELNGWKYTLTADKSMYDTIGYFLKVDSDTGTKNVFCTGMFDGMWTMDG
jgi:hypothetical protein